MRTTATDADWGQLGRTLGFAQSPGVFKVVGFIPVAGPIVFGLAAIWHLFTMIVAIRQALAYTSTWRAIGVAMIGFIAYAIVQALLQTIYRNLPARLPAHTYPRLRPNILSM